MDLELKAMVTMRALAASPNPQHSNMYTSLLLDKALTYDTVKDMIAREFASHRMTADGTPCPRQNRASDHTRATANESDSQVARYNA